MMAAQPETRAQPATAPADSALAVEVLKHSRALVVMAMGLTAIYFFGKALADTFAHTEDRLEWYLNLTLASVYGLSCWAARRCSGGQLEVLVQGLSLALGAYFLTSMANALFGINAEQFAAHHVPACLYLLPLLVVQAYTYLSRVFTLLFLAVIATVSLQFLMIYGSSHSAAYENPAWWWALGAILVAVPACLLLAALQGTIYRPLRRTMARSELRISAENERLQAIENQDPRTAGLTEVGVLRVVAADLAEQHELHLLRVYLAGVEKMRSDLDDMGLDELADHIFVSLREGLGDRVRYARLRDDLFICWNPIFSLDMLQSSQLLIEQRLQGSTFNTGRRLSFELCTQSTTAHSAFEAAAADLLARAKNQTAVLHGGTA